MEPVEVFDTAEPLWGLALALNSEEIGASSQQAQALAEGDPALTLKRFSYEGAIIGIPHFQPGGFGGHQDQSCCCGIVTMAGGKRGRNRTDRNLGRLPLGGLPSSEEAGDSQGVPQRKACLGFGAHRFGTFCVGRGGG